MLYTWTLGNLCAFWSRTELLTLYSHNIVSLLCYVFWCSDCLRLVGSLLLPEKKKTHTPSYLQNKAWILLDKSLLVKLVEYNIWYWWDCNMRHDCMSIIKDRCAKFLILRISSIATWLEMLISASFGKASLKNMKLLAHVGWY